MSEVYEVQRLTVDDGYGERVAEPMYKLLVGRSNYERSPYFVPGPGYRVLRHLVNGYGDVETSVVWSIDPLREPGDPLYR